MKCEEGRKEGRNVAYIQIQPKQKEGRTKEGRQEYNEEGIRDSMRKGN
jgi:hypothetical protein